MAEYIYKYFNNSAHIIIKSNNVKDIYNHQDILCILINNYQLLNPNYIYVSNKRDNLAICVGDNINYMGTVKISFQEVTEKLDLPIITTLRYINEKELNNE